MQLTVCNNSCLKKLKEGNCNQKSISAQKFEPLVLDTIKGHLLSEIHLSKLATLVLDEFKVLQTDSTELFSNSERQLAEVEKKIRLSHYLSVADGFAVRSCAE